MGRVVVEQYVVSIRRPHRVIDPDGGIGELEYLIWLAAIHWSDPDGLMALHVDDVTMVGRKGDVSPTRYVREACRSPGLHVDREDLRSTRRLGPEDDALAVGGPAHEVSRRAFARELARIRAIGVHHPEL